MEPLHLLSTYGGYVTWEAIFLIINLHEILTLKMM